jgi:hypothetical protein
MKLIPKLAVGLLLAGLPLFAQIHGVPASVTSHGPGRGPAPGVPASVTSIGRGIQGGTVTPVRPSVTSLGPNGFSSTCTNSGLVPSALGCTNPAFTPTVNFHSGQVEFGKQFDTRGSRRRNTYVYVPYAYPYYGYDNGYDQGYDPNQQQQAADQQQMMDQQQGEDPNRVAPTVFDNGQYMGPMPQRSAAPAPAPVQQASAGITSAALPPVDPTVLVFRDGHQMEVRNYAIVGDTLYDIGGTTAKKIKLSDLDLEKTAQVNDQRGVEFQLPKSVD